MVNKIWNYLFQATHPKSNYWYKRKVYQIKDNSLRKYILEYFFFSNLYLILHEGRDVRMPIPVGLFKLITKLNTFSKVLHETNIYNRTGCETIDKLDHK